MNTVEVTEQTTPANVAATCCVVEVVEIPPTTTVVEVVNSGPQGVPGEQGERGLANILPMKANGPIGGHRAVISAGNGAVAYADCRNPAHAGRLLGITLNAANAGENLDVLLIGGAKWPNLAFETEKPIFLGEDGLLTQTVPNTAAFVQVVGYAIAADEICVSIGIQIFMS